MKPLSFPRLLVACALLATSLHAQVVPNTALTLDQEASRFLAQATFGPTPATIAEVRALTNNYSLWITNQAALPVTLSVPLIDAAEAAGLFTGSANDTHNRYARNQVMLTAPDQLRQRMAYALSQIMVVSDQDSVIQNADTGSSSYYDMLARNALGNFRTLLAEVTSHPAMGRYLSHYKNRKADATLGTRPDENYAREVMQLFTLGLYNLNPDGTIITSGGRPVESYTDNNVTEFARVFTGYTDFSTVTTGTNFPNVTANYITPMRMWEPQHDTAAKTLFNYPGARKPVLPANQTGVQDIADALDNLVEHPNTAPFISKLLIQRLVTSNPTPAYVRRVSDVFVNNGATPAVRGDLLAVARAILTDTEARTLSQTTVANHGRLHDPFLRITNFMRAYNFTLVANTPPAIDHLRYNLNISQANIGHYPMSSPSVFNFWSPEYALPGPIATGNLVSPEFQVMNTVFAVNIPNTLYNMVQNATLGNFRADFTALTNLAATPTTFLDELNTLLCHGQMSTQTRAAILTAVNGVNATTSGANINRDRMRVGLYLTLLSPDCAVQK